MTRWEIEEKKEDVKPEKKAKSYGKARKGIYFGSGLGFEGTEAYKLLRTNLKFAIPADKECKVIGVTSSLRGEGKSTTATNLAYMVAEDGASVLLIEADMRLPGIVSKLRLEETSGSLQSGWPACAIQRMRSFHRPETVSSVWYRPGRCRPTRRNFLAPMP